MPSSVAPNPVLPVSTYNIVGAVSAGAAARSGPGAIGWYYISNNAAEKAYVKFYDAAAVNPATDTPKLVLEIPAYGAANVNLDRPITFDTAIFVRACTGAAAANVTSPGANEVIINFTHF